MKLSKIVAAIPEIVVKKTDEQKKVDNRVKHAEYKANRDYALSVLVGYAQENGCRDPEIVAALSFFQKKPLTPKVNPADALLSILGPSGQIHEDILWNSEKLGRVEMQKMIARAVNAKSPIFVSFDQASGIYKNEGTTLPEGWKGALPKSAK